MVHSHLKPNHQVRWRVTASFRLFPLFPLSFPFNWTICKANSSKRIKWRTSKPREERVTDTWPKLVKYEYKPKLNTTCPKILGQPTCARTIMGISGYVVLIAVATWKFGGQGFPTCINEGYTKKRLEMPGPVLRGFKTHTHIYKYILPIR